MFKRSFGSSRDHGARVDKTTRLKRSHGSSGRDAKLSKLQRSINGPGAAAAAPSSSSPATAAAARDNNSRASPDSPLAPPPSPIITLTVGADGRIFAAHEDMLCQAPFFEAVCRGASAAVAGTGNNGNGNGSGSGSGNSRRIHLPDEEPEVFSAVLEYLYKGDYYPRLIPGKHRDSWHLEDDADRPRPSIGSSPSSVPATPNLGGNNSGSGPANPAASPPTSRPEATIRLAGTGEHVLRDTVIYCAAERYGLDGLKRLSLRKQGLQSGIDVATILRSARYAYGHTPDTDSRLRAHYLALIIRCRRTFKRSGTMQSEMERGDTKLFFDLFVAMCNHLDDVIEAGNSKSPRMV